MSVQIDCKNVSLGYEGSIVTQDLSFSVSSGDYLYILGENGSGKSTLVKALLGLKPQISGEITRGEGVAAGQIGYLPQQTVVQRDFPASVREIVMSGCLSKSGLRPFYTAAERASANAAMERLGITGLAKRCYRELSGGQQQRVLLARALCAAGKILLLDEPVTGLDPKAQVDLYEMIGKLNSEGVTIIMVSHDVGAAMRYASHILHIGSHKQLFFGTAEDYAKSSVGRTFIASEEAENDD
ncbi:MAG: metal ABC transporter ATP-binding protein [Ruminococcus sp.]|nr:metal ABC transporter ATP-binding protein [Ruminococcus sp.]